MRLSFVGSPLQAQLSSDRAMRRAWGATADHVQMCLTLLDAAPVLGDLLSFASLSIRVASEGVLVTHRGATVVLTPLDRRGHTVGTVNSWPSGLPPELRATERARVDGLRVRAAAGSASGRLR